MYSYDLDYSFIFDFSKGFGDSERYQSDSRVRRHTRKSIIF